MRGSAHTKLRAARLGPLITMACVLWLATPCASAQSVIPEPHLTAQQEADQAAIRNVQLDMDVVQRLSAALQAGGRKHVPCANDSSTMHDIDAMVHEMVAAHPEVVPLLAHYGFTPRQFVTTLLALINTAVAAEMLSRPTSPITQQFEKHAAYNSRNVAFYDAHRAEITAVMHKAQSGSSCSD